MGDPNMGVISRGVISMVVIHNVIIVAYQTKAIPLLNLPYTMHSFNSSIHHCYLERVSLTFVFLSNVQESYNLFHDSIINSCIKYCF